MVIHARKHAYGVHYSKLLIKKCEDYRENFTLKTL